MALNVDIVESVANSNFKTMAEQTQVTANLMAQNAAAHQNRLNLVAEASIGQIVKNLNEFDTEQATSVATVLDSRLGPVLAALNATIASAQQNTKAAQTTPPVTA